MLESLPTPLNVDGYLDSLVSLLDALELSNLGELKTADEAYHSSYKGFISIASTRKALYGKTALVSSIQKERDVLKSRIETLETENGSMKERAGRVGALETQLKEAEDKLKEVEDKYQEVYSGVPRALENAAMKARGELLLEFKLGKSATCEVDKILEDFKELLLEDYEETYQYVIGGDRSPVGDGPGGGRDDAA